MSGKKLALFIVFGTIGAAALIFLVFQLYFMMNS